MEEAALREAVAGLDRAFPDGWRSGDQTTDALVVLMAQKFQRLVRAMLVEPPR